MEKKTYGQRINEVRKDRGITAEKLSETCNINAVYVRQIESGTKTPSLPVFIDLCNALKVSPDYILQDVLVENEVSDIQLLTELWKKSTPSKQATAAVMLKAYLESESE